MAEAKTIIADLFALADITIDGSRAFDLQVHDERLYDRLLKERELGLGEAYMDGWWDAERPDELIARLSSAHIREKVHVNRKIVWSVARAHMINLQTVDKASQNAAHHYNIGNDLYERMLDPRMIYSCGYWQASKTLADAQTAKLDLICRKLHLEKGMELLDIGCGWGGFAEYAARTYGVKVTGISPAAEQIKLAKQRTKGLDVNIMQKDYREITGSFDRIVSIGMLEHVGHKNYQQFFACCEKLLNDNGLMLHHFIGKNRTTRYTDPWVDKYIFPGGYLPSLTDISRAVENRFIIEDVHNFGPDYDKTLMAWHKNFAKHYPEIKQKYDERFYRMWEYYLLACAGSFRARNLELWQCVMRKIEPSSTYIGVR